MKVFELEEVSKKEKLVYGLPCPAEPETTHIITKVLIKTNAEIERLIYSMHKKFEKLVKS